VSFEMQARAALGSDWGADGAPGEPERSLRQLPSDLGIPPFGHERSGDAEEIVICVPE